MLRLNKKTEYALLALRSLWRVSDTSEPEGPPVPPAGRDSAAEGPAAPGLVTAKAIAQRYQIPEMLLAKVLQKLKKRGLVLAAKGSGGGYRLARPLGQIPLLAILELFDEHTSLVECQGDDGGQCQQLAHCDIKGPLAVLNSAVMEPLKRMTVEDLFVTPRPSTRRFAILQA